MLPAAPMTLALIGLLTGVVIGTTGMGGGALLTPLLVLGLGVDPRVAVSSDVVLSLLIKPIGVGVHAAHGTVRRDIVKWLAAGSVPSAFIGSMMFHKLGIGDGATRPIQTVIGIALMIAAGAQLLKIMAKPSASTFAMPVRPLITFVIGLLGGTLVGLTSVGSGSLMLVLLAWTYPSLTSAELVGTDLAQAVPLVGAAALGHIIFGNPSYGLVTWLLLGAVPGVIVGSRFSTRTPDRVIRPIIGTILATTGLKLIGAF